VNGQPTNYTLDLNTGLTQVLNDGTNTYTYGLGRISQTNTVTEYFLGDALGSVRQLTNASGVITYAKAYDPYGTVTSTNGASQSAYGFTGEQQDVSGLTYLRARYYASGMGRFLTRDTWMGDYDRPMSLNRWNYVYSNPVNLSDPSGHDPWWCDEIENPAQCVADWIRSHVIVFSGSTPILTCIPIEGVTPTLDTVPLSHVGDPVPGRPDLLMTYGGNQFAELYDLMKSATDTWWNQGGNFTFEQFVGLLLMQEGAGNYLFSMLDAFAGAQQLYVGGGAKGAYGPYCPAEPCHNGVFNYWAAFSQSSRNLVNIYVKGHADISTLPVYGGRDPARVLRDATDYGSAMLHPKHQDFTTTMQPISHVTWDLDSNQNSGLSDYGNDYYALVASLKSSGNGFLPYTYYPGGKQGIYYFTDTDDRAAVWFSANGSQTWIP